jgi:hypothetical protein
VFILDFSLELEQEETDSINKLLYTLNHKCEYYHKLYNMFHHAYHHSIVPVIMDTSHHIRDHYCWIYNYLYKQCLSPLMLWVRTPLMAKCSWYNIMWKSLSVTCGRSLVFPGYSCFLHIGISWNLLLSSLHMNLLQENRMVHVSPKSSAHCKEGN